MGEVYMHEAVSRPAAADRRYGRGGEGKGEGGPGRAAIGCHFCGLNTLQVLEVASVIT